MSQEFGPIVPTEDHHGHYPKSRSGPDQHLSLSRCPACYKQRTWRGHDGESSSSAEDSGPDGDWESDEESSLSSSSTSREDLSEKPEQPETEEPLAEGGDAAAPEPGGQDGDGQEGTGETAVGQENKNGTKGVTRRAPLIKSFSLPCSLTPRLTPLSLLPRPRTIISTLHLQVEQNADAFHIKHRLSEKDKEVSRGARGGIDLLRPLPLPWQHRSQPSLHQHQLQHEYQQQQHQPPPQLSHQHQQQQQQPQLFPPPSAQGQRLPPPPATLPVFHPPVPHAPLQPLNAPQTHLHAVGPQWCWHCYSLPSSPYWSHYSGGHLHT